MGDNIFEDDFSDLKLNYFDSWCHIFLKEVPDPERFGVPVFQGMDRHLVKVEEKPEKPMSDWPSLQDFICLITKFGVLSTH